MNWRYDEVKLFQTINNPLKHPNQIHQPTLLMSLFFSACFLTSCTQSLLRVVGSGLVHVCMFGIMVLTYGPKRPLLLAKNTRKQPSNQSWESALWPHLLDLHHPCYFFFFLEHRIRKWEMEMPKSKHKTCNLHVLCSKKKGRWKHFLWRIQH